MRFIGVKKFPEGWDEIEPTLAEFENKMLDAQNESTTGKRKNEVVWPITRIHHQRSRYVFQLYKQKKISRELYDFCVKQKLVDTALVAMWKKPGYENLCCMKCAQNSVHNFGTTCICRVPKSKLKKGTVVECVYCGCRGCASGDGGLKGMKRSHEEEEEETTGYDSKKTLDDHIEKEDHKEEEEDNKEEEKDNEKEESQEESNSNNESSDSEGPQPENDE
ncbi:hypothetical protein WA158_005047 [Blastocystis sp. Blastoise]